MVGALWLLVIVLFGVEPAEWWRNLKQKRNFSEPVSDSASLWDADRPPFEGRRPLTHCGITYNRDKVILNRQLDGWFSASRKRFPASPRGLIVPHAAIDICGELGMPPFALVDPSIVQRVILIATAHHQPFNSPMLSRFSRYETPYGDVAIDREVQRQLLETGHYERLSEHDDFLEHSVENVLIYVSKMMRSRDYRFLPILIGNLTSEHAEVIAQGLVEYMVMKNTLFVLSIDLCHWGTIYNFTLGGLTHAKETVQALDEAAIGCIQSLDPLRFHYWLKATGHNMCGDTATLLFLHIVKLATLRKGFASSLEILDYKVGSPFNDSFVGCFSAALLPYWSSHTQNHYNN